jgi:hypothetical protein
MPITYSSLGAIWCLVMACFIVWYMPLVAAESLPGCPPPFLRSVPDTTITGIIWAMPQRVHCPQHGQVHNRSFDRGFAELDVFHGETSTRREILSREQADSNRSENDPYLQIGDAFRLEATAAMARVRVRDRFP